MCLQGVVSLGLCSYSLSGGILINVGTTCALLALTWAGIRFPWTSVQVITVLVTGLVIICLFFLYEFLFSKDPILPLLAMPNRTTFSAYVLSLDSSLNSSFLTHKIAICRRFFTASSARHSFVSGGLVASLSGLTK